MTRHYVWDIHFVSSFSSWGLANKPDGALLVRTYVVDADPEIASIHLAWLSVTVEMPLTFLSMAQACAFGYRRSGIRMNAYETCAPVPRLELSMIAPLSPGRIRCDPLSKSNMLTLE